MKFVDSTGERLEDDSIPNSTSLTSPDDDKPLSRKRNSVLSCIGGQIRAKPQSHRYQQSLANYQTAKNVEDYLRLEKIAFQSYKNEPKLLILGSSDSGKSTLLKQFKLLHGSGFTDVERIEARSYIYAGVAIAMLAIFNACDAASQKVLDQSFSETLNYIETYNLDMEAGLIDHKKAIIGMWESKEFSHIVRFNQGLVTPTTESFLDNLKEVLKENYIPSDQDLLNCRVVTSEASESVFQISKLKFHFFDVSGLKQDRAKWLQYFDDITSVLFVISLSCFDQTMAEDPTINRMADSLTLFDQMVNHRLLETASFVLFLNKIDLFKQKIKVKSIEEYFPDFKGKKGDLKAGVQYFSTKFLSCIQSKSAAISAKRGEVKLHVTCATDKTSMKKILDNLVSATVHSRMDDAGLV